ncbi:MAG: hypothetical protein OEZ43_17915 [Gammaproteobacteria bacterium]|nr:hypothetical protein [Gammaproteobacteria bacterium]
MDWKTTIVIGFGLLVLNTSAFSVTILENEPLMKDAMVQFSLASDGVASAVDPALTFFRELQQRYPEDPMILARIGSLTSMQARDAWAPWNKMRYAEQGLDMLDQALEKVEPDSKDTFRGVHYIHSVRLIAAITFSQMPGFFNRHGQAERLFNKIVSDSAFTQTPQDFQAQVWLSYADMAVQQNQTLLARTRLKKAAAISPQSEAGNKATQLLLSGDIQ